MANKKKELVEMESTVVEYTVPDENDIMENEITNTVAVNSMNQPDNIPHTDTDNSMLPVFAETDMTDEYLQNSEVPDDNAVFVEDKYALETDDESSPAVQDFSNEENSFEQEDNSDLQTKDAAEPTPEKPKRSTRRKKASDATEVKELSDKMHTETTTESTDVFTEETNNISQAIDIPDTENITVDVAPSQRKNGQLRRDNSILTIRSKDDVETVEDKENIIWHEIHNAYRTRRILTGQLGGIEQLDNRKTVAIVDYKGFRILVPIKEMMINLGRAPSGQEYTELMLRQNKILGNMLGASIDFVVRGIDSKTRSVVASRREAMMRKRQTFYFDTDADGMYRIYENRIVQARVIAVAEKVIRVEVFGVECSILARDLAWDWIGDAHERFSVGDEVLVRIISVNRDNLENLSIRVDIKSTSENTNRDNLLRCRIQGKYAGKVTDVRKGVVYVRLSNGVNAVAHSCYDYRTPGKKDDVSFAVTRLDMERGVAVGIITRIIRQNL